MHRNLIFTTLALLGLGLALPACTHLRDTHEGLQGVLWMQTSAEYHVLAETAYQRAQVLLESALQDPQWTAATEQTNAYQTLPPAVILDLDETVLDNSPFQAQLSLERTYYQTNIWADWVKRAHAGAIPGAIDFLKAAAKKGVRVVFVTNRTKEEETATLANLAALGISTKGEWVLCSGENGWVSDKTERRRVIAQTHRIVLLIGDDMNDFISTSKLTPEARVKLAKIHEARWSQHWVLIPNPTYGSWDRAIYPNVRDDAEILAKKFKTLKGFRP